MIPQTQSQLTDQPVLELCNLRIAFHNEPPVVAGVNLSIRSGRILCLVGETGSGKSVIALALMRLLSQDARVSADTLRFEGKDVLAASTDDLEKLRGNRMAIVFQDSSLSLNPLMTIGDQIAEVLQTHLPGDRLETRNLVLTMLDRVRMPGGDERFDFFAHQLSGGMRQRVLIAMSLICHPALLIADEPTSALDAIVQREIIDLISDLRRQFGTAVLLITHDLLLVEDLADEIEVLFAGQIVERGHRSDIFDDPQHPYTLALLSALAYGACTDNGPFSTARANLDVVPATDGCCFHPRCPVAIDLCRKEKPVLMALSPTHGVACWRAPLEKALG